MAIIFQFLLSVGSALNFVYMKYFGPQEELNSKADLLNLEDERAKLVTSYETLQLDDSMQSVAFRAYHVRTSEQMDLDEELIAEAFEGSIFSIIITATLMIFIQV